MDVNVTMDDFFANANILITGGTGFLGKVLIEKILRSQSTVNNIFLLIRSKKGKDICTRASEQIFDLPIFENLKKQNPYYRSKVTVVEGNILQPELGLSEEMKQKLISKVNIIFHCAASINMKASLKYNVKHNLESVFELLKLCRQMKKLKSIVLVSTAYSNCDKSIIEEKLYHTSVSPELVIRMCKEMDDDTIEEVTKIILNGHPNTYTFTKSLMESALYNYKDLPIILFRPAVVISSYMEPVPGWIDNYNGPMGMMLACAAGMQRLFLGRGDSKMNCVPVDYSANALICSAWHGVQNRFKNDNQVMVYNYTCDKVKLTVDTYLATIFNSDIKLERCIWKQCYVIVRNEYLYLFLRFILEEIPALLLDVVLALSGHKYRLIRLYKEKIYPQINVLAFFAFNEYTFLEENVCAMWNSLSNKEKERYPFNSTYLDFDLLLRNTLMGIKIYLAKEKLEDNHRAVKRHRILTAIHYAFSAIFLSGIIWILYNLFNYLFGIGGI